MKLVIDRKTWIRGEDSGASCLLRSSDGKKCCLGFYALACGLHENQIREKPAPANLSNTGIKQWNDTMYRSIPTDAYQTLKHSSIAQHLMLINDEVCFSSEEEREQKIKELFARIGVEVEFK